MLSAFMGNDRLHAVLRPARTKNKFMLKISFKYSILRTFSLLLMITVVSIAVNFYYSSKIAVLELSDQLVKEYTERVIERTAHYLSTPAMQIKPLSQLPYTSHLVKNYEKIWQTMWQQLLIFPQVQTIFMADRQGNYVQVRREPEFSTRFINRSITPPIEKWIFRDAAYHIVQTQLKESILLKEPTFDPRTRPWYQNTQAKPQIYWTDVFIFTTTKTPGISASYPILNKEGKMLGVACLNIPLHSLSKFLANQKIRQHSIALVINQKGELVAYPDSHQLIKENAATKNLELRHIKEVKEQWIAAAYEKHLQTSAGRFIFTTAGKNYVVIATAFPESFIPGWKVIVVIPEDELLDFVDWLILETVMISLLIFLVSVVFIYIFAAKVTDPIVHLAMECRKVREMRLEEFMPVSSHILEIDAMSHATTSMVQGLQAFKKYVPASLVRQLIELKQETKLGGEEKELTIFFSDIKDFTHISEQMASQELMIYLSEYLENLSKVILEYSGTIDKYIGDAIMAFWGAPVKLTNAPYLACKAALLCQQKAEELNLCWKHKGQPPSYTRIGIHTGNIIVGNLGSEERMNYTIIGDNVNLASRLEGINKFYGTNIVISESTYQQVAEYFLCRPLDIVAVKGKSRGIRVYELIADKSQAIAPELEIFCRDYTMALEAYFQREWKQALDMFTEFTQHFPNDKAAFLFALRCQKFQNHPELIPPDWNGTTILNEK